VDLEAPTRGLIYLFHGLFYGMFLLRRGPRGAVGAEAPSASEPQAARGARALVALHGVAFAAMYYGVGQAVAAPGRMRLLWATHPILGGAVILAGAALLAWTLRVFRSWRFQARIDAGHRLSTDGPFAWVRHPIYAALDLLALGTLVWIPTPWTGAGLLLMAVMGDVRARGEEKVLVAAFGESYRRYRASVRRFVPKIY
jgi:protein-S-isoprenylcysteine O-methyltransferase Ste14